jgi:hypothetical protein
MRDQTIQRVTSTLGLACWAHHSDLCLLLYPRMGHPAAGKQFRRDVFRFLSQEYITAKHLA